MGQDLLVYHVSGVGQDCVTRLLNCWVTFSCSSYLSLSFVLQTAPLTLVQHPWPSPTLFAPSPNGSQPNPQSGDHSHPTSPPPPADRPVGRSAGRRHAGGVVLTCQKYNPSEIVAKETGHRLAMPCPRKKQNYFTNHLLSSAAPRTPKRRVAFLLRI